MIKHVLAWVCTTAALVGCGGADSSTTTITGGGVSGPVSGQEVGGPFFQLPNNLSVTVDNGPMNSFSLGVANILYASVTLCAPGSQTNCQTIDHVQVDTGSVGLRVLASKVGQLGLPPVELDPSSTTGLTGRAHECYPFVIGGLWGPTAVADVQLGEQWAMALPVQLIQDDPGAAVQAPIDCSQAVNGQVLSSASMLGSNGILGIGSVTLDCGELCRIGNYSGTYVQYYSCPPNALSALKCSPSAVGVHQQVFNPVAALNRDKQGVADNNGVVLVLPPVTGLGASRVQGELIFGINTRANNVLSKDASRIYLGVDWFNRPDSYLNITTKYKDLTIYNSYLDTGTNGLFFTDNAVTRCQGSTWYCPPSRLQQTAILSDGDKPLNGSLNVQFNIGNADALFSTSNTAFGDLAGTYDPLMGSTASFSWGLPFFYGRRVFLSIWKQSGAEGGPWYSWASN